MKALGPQLPMLPWSAQVLLPADSPMQLADICILLFQLICQKCFHEHTGEIRDLSVFIYP